MITNVAVKSSITDVPKHVEMLTVVGVIAGICIGIKNQSGVIKTAIYAVALGIVGNYASTKYEDFRNKND